MLDFVKQAPSRSKSGHDTNAWEELNELDSLLSSQGPNDVLLRTEIRERADRIRSRIEKSSYPNRDELRQYVRAIELLRDVGLETPKDLATLRPLAWVAVCYYRHIKDIPALARALHIFANLCRRLGDKRAEWQMTRYAYHLLEQPRGTVSLNTKRVLHHVRYWDLQSCVEGYGDRDTDRKHDALIQLARDIADPMAWLQTWQALAGYYRMRGTVKDAEKAIAELDVLRRTVPLPTFSGPTLYRAEIELYIDEDLDRAIDLIENHYVPAYRVDPRMYFFKQLQRWMRVKGLSLQINPPTYETPMILGMPRGEL